MGTMCYLVQTGIYDMNQFSVFAPLVCSSGMVYFTSVIIPKAQLNSDSSCWWKIKVGIDALGHIKKKI